MIFLLLFLAFITAFYVWIKRQYTYWERLKVPGPEPTWFVGNIGPTLNFSQHFGLITEKWYKEFSNAPYIGYYKMMQPAIVLRDADLIKDVLMKDFSSFQNNDFILSERFDPLLATNPFFSTDEVWKMSRKTILPAFSPNKVKAVFPLMESSGEKMLNYIKSFPENQDFEAKSLSVRFTTENVAKSGFSIDANCFDRKDESEFLDVQKRVFEPSLLPGLKFVVFPILPKWFLDLIPIPFLPKDLDQFFSNLVKQNKASRKGNTQITDVLQMLIQTQQKHDFSDLFLTGHSLSFFLDGTETSSTAMAFALYELARNPECQEKLYDEIVDILRKYDNKLCYEAFQEMSYLEWVLLESMRLNPPLMVMAKICTEKYILPKTSSDSEPVTIYPGTSIRIPVKAIHMDPQHYPNPDEFIPERFTDEEQKNRHKGVYLPFGEGPRICVGVRFAMVQVKVGILSIVKNYKIKLSPNHKPIVLSGATLLSLANDGLLINLEPREK